MNAKGLLALAMLVTALAAVGCGGGSDSTGGATGAATEAESSAPETSGGGSEGGSVPSESEAAPSGEARKAEKVEIVEYTYGPDPVEIQVGGKVIWQNQDTAPHTATADDDSFDTGTLEKGKIGSATFKQPGEYSYHCEIHPTMHGTVVVVD